jgi:hypothetical protein
VLMLRIKAYLAGQRHAKQVWAQPAKIVLEKKGGLVNPCRAAAKMKILMLPWKIMGGGDATKDGRYLTYCKPGGTYLPTGAL